MVTPMPSFRSFARLHGVAAGIVALLLTGGAVVGCGLPDEDNIEVSVSVTDVSLALSPATLGQQLAGSFSLTAILGELAQQDSTVKWEKFALTRASSNEELLALPIAATVQPSIAVPKGSTQKLPVQLEAKLVDAAIVNNLCSGQVRVAATTVDSATGNVKPAYSEPFTLAGCP